MCGWWNAYKTPTGLLGKPDDIESYEEFGAEDITVYVDRKILEEYLKDNVLYINIEGYGKYIFKIIE